MKSNPKQTDSPHIPYATVRKMVVDLELEGEERRDTIAKLAWRPAWAIRSRRGTMSLLREMFRRQKRN